MHSISRTFRLGLLVSALYAAPAGACTISVSGVPFGTYDTFAPNAITTAAQIEIDCQRGSDHPVIALGTGGSGSFAAREMSYGADRLRYNLYTNASYAVVWGDGSGGTATVVPTEYKNKQFRTTIYGRIPARQNVRAGNYGDTIFVTVNF